ncbi:MAG: hypothetical protein CMH57_07095 [Myxococcales bacterium]|nr:hypothetical protein [Myxococcales bacterium]
MTQLAYDDLARQVLAMLIASGRLKAAERDRLIAYETYYLPPRVRVELPDADAHLPLLNPHTTDEHAQALASSLMHVATTEERDRWVLTTPDVAVTVALSSSGAPSAEPLYHLTETPSPEAATPAEPTEALLRFKLQRGDDLILRRGDGLVPVVRDRRSPRLSVLEAPDEGDEVAFLIVGGPTRVQTADGRSRDYPAHAQIPITHDVTFRVQGSRWLPWARSVEGEAQVLGVSRMQRPSLLVITPEDGPTEWNRNRNPSVRVGGDDADIAHAELRLKLDSGAGDQISIESVMRRPARATWFDQRPVRIPALEALPLQGSHLRALGHGEGSLPVKMAGRAPLSNPWCVEVRGWSPPAPTSQEPFSGLFGFEQPVATIFEDGLLLKPSASQEPLRLPVESPELVKPLFRIALDGCHGCKLMPLTAELTTEDLELEADTWSWAQGLITLNLPGLRLRLEALEQVKLVYGEPQWTAELSADPEDAWQLGGWRLQVTSASLNIHGAGRVDLSVDRRPVSQAMELPAAREHRVQAGRHLYRIVRRRT